LPSVDSRLQDRYLQLVQENLAPLDGAAAGLRALPGVASAFASTQAAWRFYKNPRVTLSRLAAPLIDHARRASADACDDYALVVHDWSFLHYKTHPSKADRTALGNSQDLGYELLTALVLGDRDGAPLAPVCQELRAQGGVLTTRAERRRRAVSQLDALGPVMAHVDGLGLARPTVHVIDAEADSVAHYRRWHRQGRLFLVRADDARYVLHQGRECQLSAVADGLRPQRAFRRARAVEFEGKQAEQWVAEAEVVLHRPARPQRRGQPRRPIPGVPLALRLVVSEVRRADGVVLARWLLLTNLPAAVAAERVALWYYWRWRVETYFKLLKKAGLHLEQWRQETAAALVRRLLVAGMACCVVWHLARSKAPEAERWRELLVRLSGRQMGWGKAYTEPALLAGLWMLLAMLELLEQEDLEELRRLGRFARPSADPPDGS